MITRDELENAIHYCGWACVECSSSELKAVYDHGEWIPSSGHWRLPGGSWCPCLTPGSVAMLRCWLDINEALGCAGLALPDYGALALVSKRVATCR